jgi:hypothetical protein
MYPFLFTLLLLVPQGHTVDDIPKNAIPQTSPCADQPQNVEALEASFKKGRLPKPDEMTGSWVAIGFVGDLLSLNCDGVKRASRFEWVIVADGYAVGMDIIGTSHQKTTLKPIDGGSLALRVDFGGDYPPTYRCRLTERMTLACIFPGRGRSATPVGVEFKKMSTKQ